jgi:hypothetical protein
MVTTLRRGAGRRVRRVLILALVACACATVPTTSGLTMMRVETSAVRVEVEYEPQDEAAAGQIAKVLPAVIGHLDQWGAFVAPLRIRVQPSHEALESSVGQYGFPWLRAWARYDTIDLQSPRSWGETATDAQVAELLAHEMTHCLMYQLLATASDWTSKAIPLWFREGMASVTAEQGYRRPSDEALAGMLNGLRANDPLRDADSLYRTNSRLVYGAAHRAFEQLGARYGVPRIQQLLAAMRQGTDFATAFHDKVGVDEAEFEAEYTRSLRWRGWLGRAPEGLPSPLVR